MVLASHPAEVRDEYIKGELPPWFLPLPDNSAQPPDTFSEPPIITMSSLQRQQTPCPHETTKLDSIALIQERRRSAVASRQLALLNRRREFFAVKATEMAFQTFDDCLWELVWILHKKRGGPISCLCADHQEVPVLWSQNHLRESVALAKDIVTHFDVEVDSYVPAEPGPINCISKMMDPSSFAVIEELCGEWGRETFIFPYVVFPKTGEGALCTYLTLWPLPT